MNYAFLHGGGQGSWVWAETIAALKQQSPGPLHTLALDVPGCGTKRGRDTSQTGVEDIATELLADIETAGLRDVILIGHSQAGSIMPHMLTARPDLFRQAIYISCSIPLPGQSIMDMMGTGLHGENPDEIGWAVDPQTHSMHQRLKAMFCNDMDGAMEAAFMAQLGPDAWPAASYTHTGWRQEQLGQVPASYVLCLRDGVLPMPWQGIMAQRLRAARSIQLDCGHQAMNTRPHSLAEIIRHEAV